MSSEKDLLGQVFSHSSQMFHWVSEEDHPDSWIITGAKADYLSVKIPIEGTKYFLMLDVPERSIAHLQMQDYLYRITTFLLLVGVAGGGLLAWFTYRISRPLRSLCMAMQRISEGATHVRFTPDRSGFEINVLGEQMNRMLDAMQNFQSEAEKERLGRERLAEELRIGHQIQSSMLPKNIPNFPSLEIAPGYLSAREVSGDFYDLFALDDGRLLIAIGDAADKGISACLFSLSFRSMLRSAAIASTSVQSIVKMANSLLLRDTASSCFFITAWIGLYDPKTHQLAFCSQGHPPAYLKKQDGSVITLPAQGIALGVELIEPRVEHILIEKDDLLLLYTDGLIEANDPDQQLFGKERLHKWIESHSIPETSRVIEQLLSDVRLFSQNAPQSDDLTVLAIRRVR